MDNFREFQGRDLDACIAQAIKWFDTEREALEIEIVQDAKSGIFGIVGARKAKIRARRAHVAEAVRDILGRATESEESDAEAPVAPAAPAPHARARKQGSRQPRKARQPHDEAGVQAAPVAKKEQPKRAEPNSGSRRKAPHSADFGLATDSGYDDDEREDGLSGPLNLDSEAFAKAAQEIIARLVNPIAGREVSIKVDLEGGRPRVRIEWEGDAGLLIGRDGQTLAALQYMASRLLSRALGAPLRIQLDIGEYRSRQEEKLRELAHSLAERVRQTGKPASTRPLSSYHRRIVHLCLQEEPDVQTRSAGEGVMKRVVILPGRP